ncbi:MAG: hypothetical protein ACMVY4_12665 [Minwuia sp.]
MLALAFQGPDGINAFDTLAGTATICSALMNGRDCGVPSIHCFGDMDLGL